MYVTSQLTAEGFAPPGPASFELPSFFSIGSVGVTKHMFLLILAGIVVVALTYAMSRRAAVVPGRLQFAGEYVYNFARNSIARDSIGAEHYMKFVPYLFALFMFVLVNNAFGILPVLQFAPTSRISYVYGLTAITWIVYNAVGIHRHGFASYVKHMTVPAGVGGPVLLLMIPLEFVSNILVRPVTLSLRLFANMFAGHMLLILFSTGAVYLAFESDKLSYAPVGVLALIMGILVSFLEMIIIFLQAWVFALLTALYIGGAVADEQ